MNWIPCSERMPEDYDLVVFYTPAADDVPSVPCVGRRHDETWFDLLDTDQCCEPHSYNDCEVSHWMPLPGPPVEAKPSFTELHEEDEHL